MKNTPFFWSVLSHYSSKFRSVSAQMRMRNSGRAGGWMNEWIEVLSPQIQYKSIRFIFCLKKIKPAFRMCMKFCFMTLFSWQFSTFSTKFSLPKYRQLYFRFFFSNSHCSRLLKDCIKILHCFCFISLIWNTTN